MHSTIPSSGLRDPSLGMCRTCCLQWRAGRRSALSSKSLIPFVAWYLTAGRGAAGMVLQLSEDLQKIPITNKVAYRRCIMEKCITVKETIEEFQGYLAEREAHLNGEVTAAETQEEDDEDDDEEDDNDERDYSAEEADSVRRCLLLMTCGQDMLKAALQAITAVGDGVLANDADQFLIEEAYCWIAQLTQAVHLIEVDCNDLGAELYPPVDIDIQLSATSSQIPEDDSSSELLTAYHRLHASQCKAAGLLQVASLQAHFNAELLTKTADICRRLATL